MRRPLRPASPATSPLHGEALSAKLCSWGRRLRRSSSGFAGHLPIARRGVKREALFVGPTAEALELGLNTAEPATLVIDLNCAFASLEQQHDPVLRGRVLDIAAYATDAATIVS